MVESNQNVREGYKVSKFGYIPSDWNVNSISEVISVNPENISKNISADYVINYIDIESVTEGKIVGYKEVVYSDAPSRAKRKVQKNDVIISTVRPYLKAFAKVNDSLSNLICSTGFAVLRAKERMIPSYIYQFVFSDIFINQLISQMRGSNYPAVNASDVENAQIIVPPIREQQKIADILSTVDEQIENTLQLIEKTKELKKGLMQQLLSKGIGHTEFKQTELGEIPIEWEVKTFKDTTKVNQGLQIPISKRYIENPGHRYFYITNQFLKEDGETYFIENPNESVICHKDDILMTRTGNTGIVVSNVEGVFHNNFFKITFDRSVIDKNFLFFYLTSERIQKRIKILAGSTTIPDLNHGDFYSIPILIPELKEQQKIASILTSVDEQIESYEQEKEKYLELKKGLMQQLLTGKIRVTV